MKIISGFVSNSSTSSFVIAKCYMTEEQIKDFKQKLQYWESADDDLMYETYIGETPLYFLGEISQHNTVIEEWLEANKLNEFANSYC